MVRHEKTQGAIQIAWGYDDNLGGYFLTISDSRLEWRENQSKEVNEICEKVADDGAGRYFDLNTYPYGGFGYRVSKETMFTFMRRYGIDPEKIGTNKAVQIDDDVKRCRNQSCRKTEPSTLRCSNCKFAWYCSKECQKSDWKDHKEECQEFTKFRDAQAGKSA